MRTAWMMVPSRNKTQTSPQCVGELGAPIALPAPIPGPGPITGGKIESTDPVVSRGETSCGGRGCDRGWRQGGRKG